MLETIKRSVETKSMMRHKGQAIDMYSASAILAVYNKLNPENQAKFAAVIEKNVIKAASIAFQLCK